MANNHLRSDQPSRTKILNLVRSGLLNKAMDPGSSMAGVATRGAPGTPLRIAGHDLETVDLFEEVLKDYKARVLRVDIEGIPAAVAEVISSCHIKSLVVPSGLDRTWYEGVGQVQLVVDDGSGPAVGFEKIDGVITGCSCAIAETGTLVLSGRPDEGRRAITLLPDFHICIVKTEAIIRGVSELFSRIGVSNPVTLISGPSATSDIELKRVEGVHGPRNLIVVIAT